MGTKRKSLNNISNKEYRMSHRRPVPLADQKIYKTIDNVNRFVSGLVKLFPAMQVAKVEQIADLNKQLEGLLQELRKDSNNFCTNFIAIQSMTAPAPVKKGLYMEAGRAGGSAESAGKPLRTQLSDGEELHEITALDVSLYSGKGWGGALFQPIYVPVIAKTTKTVNRWKNNQKPIDMELQIINNKVVLLTRDPLHEIIVSGLINMLFDNGSLPFVNKFYGVYLCKPNQIQEDDKHFLVLGKATNTFQSLLIPSTSKIFIQTLFEGEVNGKEKAVNLTLSLMWQYIYSFYVLKEKLGIVHLDAHCGNLMFTYHSDKVVDYDGEEVPLTYNSQDMGDVVYYKHVIRDKVINAQGQMVDRVRNLYLENTGLMAKIIDFGLSQERWDKTEDKAFDRIQLDLETGTRTKQEYHGLKEAAENTNTEAFYNMDVNFMLLNIMNTFAWVKEPRTMNGVTQSYVYQDQFDEEISDYCYYLLLGNYEKDATGKYQNDWVNNLINHYKSQGLMHYRNVGISTYHDEVQDPTRATNNTPVVNQIHNSAKKGPVKATNLSVINRFFNLLQSMGNSQGNDYWLTLDRHDPRSKIDQTHRPYELLVLDLYMKKEEQSYHYNLELDTYYQKMMKYTKLCRLAHYTPAEVNSLIQMTNYTPHEQEESKILAKELINLDNYTSEEQKEIKDSFYLSILRGKHPEPRICELVKNVSVERFSPDTLVRNNIYGNEVSKEGHNPNSLWNDRKKNFKLFNGVLLAPYLEDTIIPHTMWRYLVEINPDYLQSEHIRDKMDFRFYLYQRWTNFNVPRNIGSRIWSVKMHIVAFRQEKVLVGVTSKMDIGAVGRKYLQNDGIAINGGYFIVARNNENILTPNLPVDATFSPIGYYYNGVEGKTVLEIPAPYKKYFAAIIVTSDNKILIEKYEEFQKHEVHKTTEVPQFYQLGVDLVSQYAGQKKFPRNPPGMPIESLPNVFTVLNTQIVDHHDPIIKTGYKAAFATGPILIWDGEVVFTLEMMLEEKFRLSLPNNKIQNPPKIPYGNLQEYRVSGDAKNSNMFYGEPREGPFLYGQRNSPQFIVHNVLGITNDNQIVVIMIEGRGFDTPGLDRAQLTELISLLGLWRAVSLDGGFSAQCLIRKSGVQKYLLRDPEKRNLGVSLIIQENVVPEPSAPPLEPSAPPPEPSAPPPLSEPLLDNDVKMTSTSTPARTVNVSTGQRPNRTVLAPLARIANIANVGIPVY